MGKEDETTNSSARANNNNKTRQRERAKKNKRVENAKTDGGSGIIESPSSTGNEVYVPHTNQTMETLMKKEGTSNNMLPSSSPPVSLSSKPVSSSLTFNRIFLTPEDGQIFDQVVRDHYQGFVHVPKNVGGSNFHENNKAILERLRDANYYQVRYLQYFRGFLKCDLSDFLLDCLPPFSFHQQISIVYLCVYAV